MFVSAHVDLLSAEHSIHRAAMFAGVQQSAPTQLPMVQCACEDAPPPHILRAPEGTHPAMSQRGTRQGNTLGPLWSVLTLQHVLECIDAECKKARLVLYLDDIHISGKHVPAAGSFRRLCVDGNGVRSIELELQLRKCGIYGGDKDLVATEAAKLRMVVIQSPGARWPSGSDVRTCMKQPDMRTEPREVLATHMCRTNAAVWREAAAVLDLPTGVGESNTSMEGPNKACSTLDRQETLPLRRRGLGLRMQSNVVTLGAGQAELNLEGGPAVLCPLQGASGASVRARWSNLYQWYSELRNWEAAAKDLPTEFLDCRNGLLWAQQLVMRNGDDACHAGMPSGIDHHAGAARDTTPNRFCNGCIMVYLRWHSVCIAIMVSL